MWDLRFSWWWIWTLLSSGMWCCIVWCEGTNVAMEPAVIFLSHFTLFLLCFPPHSILSLFSHSVCPWKTALQRATVLYCSPSLHLLLAHSHKIFSLFQFFIPPTLHYESALVTDLSFHLFTLILKTAFQPFKGPLFPYCFSLPLHPVCSNRTIISSRFSWHWLRTVLPPGMERCVVCWKSTDILEEHVAFIFGANCASRWFLAWLILQPQIWRWHVPSKCQLTFNGLHSVTSQETGLFIL
jgi:hypothetical protein